MAPTNQNKMINDHVRVYLLQYDITAWSRGDVQLEPKILAMIASRQSERLFAVQAPKGGRILSVHYPMARGT